MSSNPFLSLELVQRAREAQRNNEARVASVDITYRTQGTGDLLAPAATTFGGLEFIDEPAVSTGLHVEVRPDLTKFFLPRVTVGVYRWQKNSRGFFTGAFLFFAVDIRAREGVTEAPSRTTLVHHVVFTGASYKGLGAGVRAGASDDAIPPLVPPIVP